MIQSIHLKKLAPSPRNVRKVTDAAADAQLKADIAAGGAGAKHLRPKGPPRQKVDLGPGRGRDAPHDR